MRVLIADPDALHAAALISRSDLEMRHACQNNFLEEQARFRPHVALVDLSLFGKNFSNVPLAEQIRETAPACIIIAMIPSGEESNAMAALKAGAMNYLCKPVNVEFLKLIIEKYSRRVLEMERDALLSKLIVARKARIVMPTDGKLVSPVVDHILARVSELAPGAEIAEIRLGLEEILRNAVEHGNLEIGFKAKAEALERQELEEMIRKRMENPRYSQRRISIDFDIDREYFRCVVEDEGPGFDHCSLWDPLSDAGLERLNGRGIFLTKAFFDEVDYQGRGNRVLLVKQVRAREEAISPGKT